MKSFLNQKTGLFTLSLVLLGSTLFAQNMIVPQNDYKVTTITRITGEKLETFDKDAPQEIVSNSFMYHNGQKPLTISNPNKAYLGVTLDGTKEGVVILKTFPNSAAESTGLRAGDQLLSIDGKAISKISELQNIIDNHTENDVIKIEYERNGITSTKLATLKTSEYYKHSRVNYYASAPNPLSDNYSLLSSCEKLEKLGGQAFLGVYLNQSYNEDGTGALITSIINNTGAQKAALQANDKIIRLNFNNIRNTPQAMEFIKSKKPGDEVQILLVRNDQEMLINATLGSWLEAPQYVSSVTYWTKICEKANTEETIKAEETFAEQVAPEVVEEETTKEEKPASKMLMMVESNLSLQVFPNPTADFVTVNFEGENAPLVIRIISLDGKEMLSKTIKNVSGAYSEQLDLSSYASGTYRIHLSQNDKQISKNLIVR